MEGAPSQYSVVLCRLQPFVMLLVAALSLNDGLKGDFVQVEAYMFVRNRQRFKKFHVLCRRVSQNVNATRKGRRTSQSCSSVS